MKKNKLIRITTVPLSIDKLLEGQLNFMNQFYEVTAISSEYEYLKYCAKKEEVAFYHIEMTRKITILKDLKSLIQLYFFLISNRPLIVHSHTPKAGIIGMLGSKIARVPIRIHTVGGLPLMEANGFKKKLLLFIEKLTYKCSTFVYVNSKGLEEYIIDNQLTTHNKLKVLGNGSTNGINTEYFNDKNIDVNFKKKLREKLNISEEDFVYIFVGRLVADKGINELLIAFKNISHKNRNVKLILVGPLESDLDPLKSESLYEITNNENIKFVGFQKDVRPYFAISSALIFPSYREGFPNVVMQAGSMGLPSIVTNINGCNEIIIDGKNGLLIPTRNSNAIQDKMLELLNNKEIYQELKKNARTMITSRYEQKIIWDCLRKEYENFIKDKK